MRKRHTISFSLHRCTCTHNAVQKKKEDAQDTRAGIRTLQTQVISLHDLSAVFGAVVSLVLDTVHVVPLLEHPQVVIRDDGPHGIECFQEVCESHRAHLFAESDHLLQAERRRSDGNRNGDSQADKQKKQILCVVSGK